jgi:16S rRNA (adenine1518-N6/adenine1519-N6)-dimethyltransferase
MDLLKKTIDLSKQYNIIPARSKGQNFLISENIYKEIVEAADLKSDDIVLEVGPGLGFLTTKLAAKVKKVITVELDNKLAEILRADLVARGIENVEVVNENILDFKIDNPHSPLYQGNGKKIPLTPFIPPIRRASNGAFKIVANLPYNISSIFLRKFLSAENKPEMMVLMLQKEVAERIVAKPPQMSLLAVSVQYYAEAQIIDYVTKDNFWPIPEVDSAIIKIKIKEEPHPSPLLVKERGIIKDVDKDRDFFRLVKIGFSARRKMLKNNLAGGLHISTEKAENYLKLVKIDNKIRAQELSVDDWVRLVEAIREIVV